MVQPLGKTVRRVLKKLKIELPREPVILLLGINPKERKEVRPEEVRAPPVFVAAFFTKAKT